MDRCWSTTASRPIADVQSPDVRLGWRESDLEIPSPSANALALAEAGREPMRPRSGEGVRPTPFPSARSEGDDAAKRFAGLQGVVGLVDLLDRVAAGEQLIQLEAAGPIEIDQPRNVGLRRRRAVERSGQYPLLIDESGCCSPVSGSRDSAERKRNLHSGNHEYRTVGSG